MVAYNIVLAEGGADRLSTGGGSARHIDRSPDGTLWRAYRLAGNVNFYYSKDEGKTWTWTSSSQTFNGQSTHAGDFSIFIDADGYMHVALAKYVAGGNDGRTITNPVIYRRGTPNAGNTSWTWSGEVTVASQDYWHCPVVVAHRQGTGWKVHALTAYNWAGDNRTILHYWRANVTSAGVITVDASTYLHDSPGSQMYPTHPALALRHNGDGKTVQKINGVEQPDLFMAWTSSEVLHWGKLSYLGSNNWGNFSNYHAYQANGQTISSKGRIQVSSPYMEGLYQHHRWCNVLYDPATQRYVVVGMLSNPATTDQRLHCDEWDANVANSAGTFMAGYQGTSPYFYSGSCALLPTGDIEVIGIDTWSPPNSRLARVLIKRPIGSNTRTLSEHEVVETNGHDNPNVDMLTYPQASVQAMWNKGGSIYMASRSLSNVWMNVGGQPKNVMRYMNVGGNPVPIQAIRKG